MTWSLKNYLTIVKNPSKSFNQVNKGVLFPNTGKWFALKQTFSRGISSKPHLLVQWTGNFWQTWKCFCKHQIKCLNVPLQFYDGPEGSNANEKEIATERESKNKNKTQIIGETCWGWVLVSILAPMFTSFGLSDCPPRSVTSVEKRHIIM